MIHFMWRESLVALTEKKKNMINEYASSWAEIDYTHIYTQNARAYLYNNVIFSLKKKKQQP